MKDIQIKKLIETEKKRQKKVINLIASENYVSKDVLEALGSELTNKYAEGYPGKRYYGGNEIVDKIELLCIERALKLFKLDPKEWHVNVQALSGSPANLAVYTALIPPKKISLPGTENSEVLVPSKIMGMSLDHGGHLTHGHKVSATGKFFIQVPYGLDATTEVLNYDQLREQAIKEKPAIIVAGYTAYPRRIDWALMREIADGAGSLLMVDMSHIAGLVAGEVYPSPFPYADIVTTTTHKTLRGPRSALIFVKKDARELDKKIDKAVFPGLQGGPHENVIAAKAVSFLEALQPEFKTYAKQIRLNAKVLEQELSSMGYTLMFGGTDNHLLLIDVSSKGVTGGEAEKALDTVGLTVNKNMIPNDIRPPMDPSGIRLGTPALTTRGMKETEIKQIAVWIDDAITHRDDALRLDEIRLAIRELTKRFPLYPNLKYV